MQVSIIVQFLFLSLTLVLVGAKTRTTADRIASFGYSSETHKVTTNDGYILTLFRLKNLSTTDDDRQLIAKRPVVLLMHGLGSSSDGWVISGPENALSFNLVDSGYDVWLGNARGNVYSNHHVSMSNLDLEFWRFSWHEIGTIDLPNTIDYILKTTGETSLHYVGHSQGTVVMLVLLSSQPKYNQKLKTIHLMAPVAFMKNARAWPLTLGEPFANVVSTLDPILGAIHLEEIPLARQILQLDTCRNPKADKNICYAIYSLFQGGVSNYFNQSLLSEFFITNPAGYSLYQAIHFFQLHMSGHFRQYDFGVRENLRRYNSTTPPDYKLSNINPRFPIHLYYSADDRLAGSLDVERLSKILGNRSAKHFINLKGFNHNDFIWSTIVKENINRGIIERMNAAEIALNK